MSRISRRSLSGRIQLTWAVAVSAGAVLATASLASASPIAHSATRHSTAPQGAAPKGELFGVTTLGGTQAWAVGVTAGDGVGRVGGPNRTLVRHWAGAGWDTETTPNPGFRYNELDSVAAIGADDVWAVGHGVGHGLSTYVPIILHFDGTSWTSMSIDGVKRGSLAAVSACSSSDVWAVGSQPDAEHWDGTRWQPVEMASPPPDHWVAFSGVAAIDSSDVWAVGHLASRAGRGRAVIEHFDGASWRFVPSPRAASISLNAVAGLGADDVYAVGFRAVHDGGSGTSGPVVEHWDGGSWHLTRLPKSPSGIDDLFAIGGSSATDVWAVGTDGSAQTLAYHFDGRVWARVPTPSPGHGSAYLYGVAASSADDAWAVGSSHSAAGYHPVTLHWNGSRWSAVQ